MVMLMNIQNVCQKINSSEINRLFNTFKAV
jgi:hypothetical protein